MFIRSKITVVRGRRALVPAVLVVFAWVMTGSAFAQQQVTANEDDAIDSPSEVLRGRVDENGLPDFNQDQAARDATAGRNVPQTVTSRLGDVVRRREAGNTVGGPERPIFADREDGGGNVQTGNAVSAYDPLGIRVGSFLAYPAVEAGIEFTDNVALADRGRRDDLGYTIAPELRLESNWSRHAATLRASSSHLIYDENSSEDTDDVEVRATGRIDITRDTRVDLEAGFTFGQESRGTAEDDSTAETQPDETVYSATASLTQRFNRMIATIRSNLEVYEFGDAQLTGGGTQSNADRDYTEVAGSLRLGYEWTPAIQPFVEGSYSIRRHDQKTDDDGFRRDSDGHSVVGGVAVNLGPILRGEVSGGYAERRPDDSSLSDVSAVVANASLIWAPTPLTTVTAAVGTSVDETTVTGSSAALSRTAGLNVAHALFDNLTLNAGAEFDYTRYKGAGITEKSYSLSAGMDYLINRNLVVRAGYTYDIFDSNQSDSDYTANTFRIGVRLQQ